MKCPNCGTEIPENSLYCEFCGEDIHIVPDFELEVHDSYESTISRIVSEIFPSEDEVEKNHTASENDQVDYNFEETTHISEKKKSIRIGIVAVVGILFLGLAVGLLVLFLASGKSYENLAAKARECAENGDFEQAVPIYEQLFAENPEDIELASELANVYHLQGEEVLYENQLLLIADSEYASEEQLLLTYSKLIAIYEELEDYYSLADIVERCPIAQLREEYDAYRIHPVEFDLADGYYTSAQTVKLSAGTSDVIYYTIDGTDPDENSEQYKIPFSLFDGDYEIRAISVNYFGQKSAVYVGNYHVTGDKLPPPDITLFSGYYETPQLIDLVDDGEGGVIHYSVSGENPTANSPVFNGPIPLPIGRSVFKFVRVDEFGRYSDVVEREYRLLIPNSLSQSDCHARLILYLLEIGVITDENGSTYIEGARNEYDFLYPVHIENGSDYYAYIEMLYDTDGSVGSNEVYYGVNVYDGSVVRLHIDGGYFSLLE